MPADSINALVAAAPGNIAGLAHLRANLTSAEGISWEVVSYDAEGQSMMRTPQEESTSDDKDVSHDSQ